MPTHNSAVSSIDQDADLLAHLGYKQELRRHFSPLEIFSMAFSIIGLVSSFSSVLLFSIPNGGPSAMIWGWTLCSIFLTTIGLAMGELASAAPTSGGLYYWTFMFSTPRWRCFLSWIVGYANTISNVASIASIEWGCAIQIMAAASIGSDMTFQATTPQTLYVAGLSFTKTFPYIPDIINLSGLYCGLLLSHALINTLNPRVIAQMQIPFVVINLLLCAAIIIALPAVTPKDLINTPKFAFGEFRNFSDWPNGFAFILSFLTPLWTLGCFDAPVHMSEEATNASTAIPYTIIFSTVSSLILGWGINVSLAFSMGTDLEGIIDSPIDQPMATILFNSFGKKGTLVVWTFVIIVQYGIGAGILTTASRQIFAFTRDGGLPFSRFIYHVTESTGVPTRAVWFGALLCALLGTLTFAGPTAINAVFSLVVTGQYVAYSIPISARWLGERKIQPGPVSYGVMSLPIATVAVVWMVFMTVILMFPASPNPSVGDMNYAAAVQGGVLVLATMYYFFPRYGGMYWFKGPVSTVDAPEIAIGGGMVEVKVEEEKRDKA